MGQAIFLLITLPRCMLASEFLISDSDGTASRAQPQRGRGSRSVCHSVRRMINYMTEACVIHHAI